MKHRVAAVLALATLAAPIAARAGGDGSSPFADDDPFADDEDPVAPEPAPASTRPLRHRMAGVLGAGTPVGNAGVEVARTLIPRLDAAAGAGLSVAEGPKLALMLRPHLTHRRVTASLGGGVSFGFTPSARVRLDAELGVQYTHASTWSARLFAGYGFLGAGGGEEGDPMCTYDPETYREICTYADAGSGPYVGVSAGKSF